jgi:two-component system, chemotaxis family, protein-glutamate methylesterase/glutaminase
MIRVVLADDSATARELLRAVLEQDGDIRVVAEAHDGIEAVALVERHRPALVVMDVHMPRADGLAATKEIMTRAPTPIVIVSAVTRRDVDLSLRATEAGALLALPKPGEPGSARFADAAAELRAMVRAMAQVKVVRRWSPTTLATRAPATGAPASLLSDRRPADRRPAGPADAVALAASTGGPAAVHRILLELPPTFAAPILIVQHIAAGFAAGFADWLDANCALPVKLAEHNEPLRRGVVYVAPDDVHLGVTSQRRVELVATPPIGRFRPSASFLFESAGRVYGRRLVAAILTGMGSDGAAGLAAAHADGAYVLAQDEASSVIYGMAQAAVASGVVDAVLPLERIASRLLDLTVREAHVD